MLENGEFKPPYVLVVHSLAGLILRPFINANRDDITGVVFVDVSHPGQYEVTPEELQGGGPPAEFVLWLLKNFDVLRYMIASAPLPTEDSDEFYATTVPSMIHRTTGVMDEIAHTELIAKEVQSLSDFGDIPLIVITGASPSRNDNMNASEETREALQINGLNFKRIY